MHGSVHNDASGHATQEIEKGLARRRISLEKLEAEKRMD
jgi:hypothetical protein